MHASTKMRTPEAEPPPVPPLVDLCQHALFLDLDGTLVEIQERPHAVAAPPGLCDLLARLSRAMSGAIALITGRPVAEADAILSGSVAAIAGVHGYEIRRNGRMARASLDLAPMRGAAEDIRTLLQANALPALVEDKRASIALHYRHAPQAGEELRHIAAQIAKRRGLRVLEGKMVVELVAGARTKGHAVVAFMSAPPFKRRVPVVVGDDRTDEDAFAAAARAGGFGVLVGETRETAAVYALPAPDAVRMWLATSLERGTQ